MTVNGYEIKPNSNLYGANLKDANISGVSLRGANLYGANLKYADLRGANLRDTDLRGASLRDANLRGADIRGANLRGADLRGANLKDADLRGASLRDADIEGADISRVMLPYIGNTKEICSMQLEKYHITFTKDILKIGCQQHAIDTWKEFSDDTIDSMDNGALEWWNKWKDFIFFAIELSFEKISLIEPRAERRKHENN